ncbi:MAG: ATP-binding protein [Acidimicrobiaceae bacterium]|nr:ATP-binding protein [Acidimicrobiaceae bacterium]
MEIRVGMMNVVRELTFEINDDEADQLKSDLESASSAGDGMLWMTDRDGRNLGLVVSQLAYVELGVPGDRRIGFATD